jgi:hypothetical protein
MLNVQASKQILILQLGDKEPAANPFSQECNANCNLHTSKSLSRTAERTKNENMELMGDFYSDLTVITVSDKRQKSQ